jgi:hypothetical protein
MSVVFLDTVGLIAQWDTTRHFQAAGFTVLF